MSTFLRNQLQAAAVMRLKQRHRKAWAERHEKADCNCPLCQARRGLGGGVRVVSLSDLLGRDDTAETPDPATKLN